MLKCYLCGVKDKNGCLNTDGGSRGLWTGYWVIIIYIFNFESKEKSLHLKNYFEIGTLYLRLYLMYFF